MPRTHGANKLILFAQILDPYEVTPKEFAQIKDVLFAHVYKALVNIRTRIDQSKQNGLLTSIRRHTHAYTSRPLFSLYLG